jgi:rubrerythrin
MTFFAGTEIVDIAKQIERQGEAFYEEALRHLKDSKIREVFAFLREEERRHGVVFEELLRKVGDSPQRWRQDEEYLAYMRSLARNRVFPDLDAARAAAKELPDECAAIRCALGFEKDSILFLHELRTMVRPAEQETVDRLIAEEQSHVRRLQNLLDRAEDDERGRVQS